MDHPRPPESERALGLAYYASDAPGVGGRLKGSADDFEVREVSAYPYPDPGGAFTVLRVESRNWEQHELGGAIARTLHLSPHAIQWAGTKDRRAVAERLFSYRGAPPGGDLGIPGATVLEAYRARDGLSLGHHYGNVFRIQLTELNGPCGESLERALAIESELRTAGGFPNFFGPQRFGEVRPVTHSVGRRLVLGDIAGAVDLYLMERLPGESGTGADARASYAEHRDPARALREFPTAYRFERSMLEQLARGHPPLRAFRALGRELRMLFVHAYQSLLFNRYVSRRRAEGIADDLPEAGDHLVRVHRDGTISGAEPVPVEEDNLPECRELVRRDRARVAGPLIGFRTPVRSGRPGRLVEAILAEEGVTRAAFELPHLPEIASAGTWRALTVPLPPVRLVGHEPSNGIGRSALEFQFALPKGTYATVLLREFQKSGSTY